MAVRKRARRMSPEQRREQILDSAVNLIVARGLSSCTLEEVALEARISKPLIYKYFSRLQDLLKAMVEREYQYLRRSGLDVFPRDMPYEEVVRRSTLVAIEYLYERGPIIRLLASDRSVASLAHRQDRDERRNITDYFTRRRMDAFGMPKDVATIVSAMTINAPILSARALKRHGISARRAADVWSEFIIGGNNAIAARFGRKKKLSKPKVTPSKQSRQKTFVPGSNP
jgi:AcrR family transcriptional regulator